MNSQHLLRRCLLLALLTGLNLLSVTQANMGLSGVNTPISEGWTLSLENDVFVGEDNGYTNGLALYYGKGRFERFTPANTLLPVHWLLGNTYINEGVDRERAVAYGVFQAIQTPGDITDPSLQVNDVPYAGLLAFEAQLFSMSDTWVDRMTLTVGVVGPLALGGEAQESVHAIVGGDQPQGWKHQIRNEPVAALELERGVRVLKTDASRRLEADVIVVGSAALGNLHSFASAMLVARIGDNLVQTFPVASVPPNPQINPTAFSERRSWDIFAGVSSTYVANQILTSGNTFTDSHRAEIDHTRLQVSAGVGWNMRDWAFNISVTDFIGHDVADPFGSFGITRRTR